MPETLHTCPTCKQARFTARGLKTHQGGKTCTRRAAQLQQAGNRNPQSSRQ
jgi:hypothetical protein